MKKFVMAACIIIGCSLCGNANAWVQGRNVTVSNIIQWQDNAPIYFSLSNNITCYVPASEKNMYSLILGVFSSGKKVNIWCHDTPYYYGGYWGHRVHRFEAY